MAVRNLTLKYAMNKSNLIRGICYAVVCSLPKCPSFLGVCNLKFPRTCVSLEWQYWKMNYISSALKKFAWLQLMHRLKSRRKKWYGSTPPPPHILPGSLAFCTTSGRVTQMVLGTRRIFLPRLFQQNNMDDSRTRLRRVATASVSLELGFIVGRVVL